MSQKSVHSAVFDIKNFAFEDNLWGEPFVLVCNGSYLEFRLGLYPKGAVHSRSGERIEGVLAGLEFLNGEKKMRIAYKRSVEKNDGSALALHDWCLDVDFARIRTKYCTTPIASNLADLKTKNLLQDDGSSLRVAVEIQIARNYFSDEIEVEKGMDSLGYKHIELYKEVYDQLSKGQCTDADYTVACDGSDNKFSCHKFITRRRSPYFENLFSSHPGFDQQDVHKVGWSPEVTEEVLHFIYTDEASPKFDSVPVKDLVEVAEMLELKKLVLICEKSLMVRIDKVNAWDYLSMADIHKMKFLKKKALCIVTEDPALVEKLFDQRKEEGLRKEVMEFSLKRGRAQVLVQ